MKYILIDFVMKFVSEIAEIITRPISIETCKQTFLIMFALLTITVPVNI